MAQGRSRLDNSIDSVQVVQTSANSLKVDLSDTSTNSNPLIVDGSATVQPVSVADGLGNNITSHGAGSARALDISIVDGSGNQITSFGGGTQYAEGATAATPTGTVAMWKDSGNAIKSVSSSTPLPITLANTGANTTAIKVDGSAVTQPVSGTVAATQSGNWSTRTQDGSGNAITSHTAGSAKGLDVSILDGSGNQITSFGGGTQYADGAARGSATGTIAMVDDGVNIQSVRGDSSGNLYTRLSDGTNEISVNTSDSDGASNTSNRLKTTAHLKVFNGTTWDRLPGDTTGISVKSHNVTNAGTFATQATQSGTWTVQPGNTANTTPWLVTPTPGTTGGWSKSKYAAQTTTVQTVKGSAGTFGGYFAYNPNASVAYIQVFDTASSVTLGTTSPDMIFGIPANSGANLEITLGVNMGSGIKLACTTTATGSSAPGSGLDLTIFYK